jgi:uracil-DNA glycosylase family 4
MDDLAALRLLVEWGADEAVADAPLDRFAPRPAPTAAPVASTASPASTAPPMAVAARLPPLLSAAAAPARAQALAAAATSLPELHAAMEAFDGCPLRDTATSTVRPSGNPAAGLVLVAEAPAADDDRAGAAFSGAAGALMDRVLASIGLDRSGILLTHLVPWRPPGSRAPTEAEVQACLPFLMRALVLMQPRRMVLLGAAPAKALAGAADGIRRLRGRWLTVPMADGAASVPAMPMLPQEQWMRTPAAKRDLWSDLLELRQSIDTVR